MRPILIIGVHDTFICNMIYHSRLGENYKGDRYTAGPYRSQDIQVLATGVT